MGRGLGFTGYLRERQPKARCGSVCDLYRKGALDGGSPMSHVEFMTWQCPLSLFFAISMVMLK